MIKSSIAIASSLAAITLTGVLAFQYKLDGGFILQKEPEVTEPLTISINSIRQIAELSTAQTNLETIVPIQSQTEIMGQTIGTSSLTYRAIGVAKAGIDFSEISDQSFSVVGTSVVVSLPEAKILDIYLDMEKSQVYDASRGFLSLGPDNLTELLEQAQKTALKDMRRSVCPDLNLEAQKQAEVAIKNFLYGAGFTDVVFVPSEDISCGNQNLVDESYI
jgi:hypothetical protein